MSVWRFRQCPKCREVLPAGDLVTTVDGPSWGEGEMTRSCPLCGHTGQTKDFPVVHQTDDVRPAVSNWQVRKERQMRSWVRLTPIRDSVKERMGWR